MAERKSGARPKRRANAAQRAALAAGRVKRDQQRAEREAAKQHEDPTQHEDRWAMLLSGSLTVADLDDEEVARQTTRNKSGEFIGTSGRVVPSHLKQQFRNEILRRANAQVRKAVPRAVKHLTRLIDDPDVPAAVRLKAALALMDRGLGRVPETIRVEQVESTWDADAQQVFGVERDDLLTADGDVE